MPPILTSWPSEIFFHYGKDNYWGGANTVAQLLDHMDEHEFFFPGLQALYEYDHSSGHLKKGEHALSTGKMGVKYGGKGKVAPHDVVLTEFCVGSNPAILYRNPANRDQWSKAEKPGWTKVDCRLRAGQTMSFTHTDDGPPPHYNLNAPKQDRDKQISDKKAGAGAKKTIVEPGYIGKPIGKSQAVWLRGLWVDGMTDKGLLAVEDPTAAAEEREDDEGEAEAEDPYDYPSTVPGRSSTTNWAARMKEAQETLSLYKVIYCKHNKIYIS